MRLTIDHQTLSPRAQTLLQIWGHVQHEILYLSWALADVALLTPFALAVMGWARYWQPGLVLFWLLMLMLVAFNLTRLMSAIALPAQHQQAVMAVALLLVIVFTLPTLFHAGRSIFGFGWLGDIFTAVNQPGNNLWLRDVIVLLLLILVWVRGLQLGQRPYSVERAGLRLRIGGLMLAPLVIWLANTRLLWDSTPYILLFFLAGLTSLALIRAQAIEQNQQSAVRLASSVVYGRFPGQPPHHFYSGNGRSHHQRRSSRGNDRLVGSRLAWAAPDRFGSPHHLFVSACARVCSD